MDKIIQGNQAQDDEDDDNQSFEQFIHLDKQHIEDENSKEEVKSHK